MCIHISRYNKLINHYKNTVVEGFVERHHIIPKCMGGDDSFSNLVALPPRAHYIAHYLLWKAYPENRKLAHAFAMMAVSNPHQNRILGGKLYEAAKSARSSALKGVPRSEEVKEKLRKPKSTTINYYGNTNGRGNKGNKMAPRSEEHTKKLVESQRRYHEKRSKEAKEKADYYREEFLNSGLTRKQFADKHGIPYATMKGYLKGL